MQNCLALSLAWFTLGRDFAVGAWSRDVDAASLGYHCLSCALISFFVATSVLAVSAPFRIPVGLDALRCRAPPRNAPTRCSDSCTCHNIVGIYRRPIIHGVPNAIASVKRVLAQPSSGVHRISTYLPQALQSSLSLVRSITTWGARHLWCWKVDQVMTHLHWRHIVNRS
jgi:hypothetical protein